MAPWKSEALKKQLEEETGNLLRWEADEEVANKELDAKLKHVAEVKVAQNTEIEALEKQNEILRKRVAVAEQKKEEMQRKALFAQRKSEVLLERFNMVATDVERVQSRGSVVKVSVEPVEELTKAMRQLEVAHRQEKQEKAAESRKVVAEGEQQAQQLAVKKQRIQDLNVELEGELAKGDGEMKDLEDRLKQLKSAKEDLDEEDARLDEVLKEQECEIKKVDEQLAEQEREIRRRKEDAKEAEEMFNKQLGQEQEEVDQIEKQVEELRKLEANLKKTKATEEDELLDLKTSIKELVAQNDALTGEVKQLEVQVLDITQGKQTEAVLEEMRIQIEEANMATKVAESQGAAMAEVEKEKEELVRRNSEHNEELERLASENKNVEVGLAAKKETLSHLKEQVVELLEKQKMEDEQILEHETKAEELQKCLEEELSRANEAQLMVNSLEKETEEEQQRSSDLKAELEMKTKQKEVEVLKQAKVSARIQEVCQKVAEIRAVKDKLVNDLKELDLQRANGDHTLTNLRLKEEEVSAQILAEDRIHQDYEVQGAEEVKRLEQAKEKLKQVDDQLKLKELEGNEKEKITTALEAAVKEKKEELQEMARQAECLGKEVAPGEEEADQAKQLLDELTAKLEQTQTNLAKEKEAEEFKLKETEQEAAEVKEMKAKLAESLTEAKQVAGEEKMLRKKDKDRKIELANLETEMNKMKTVVESASGENAKLAEENEILAETLSNLEAEADAVKRKKLNFGEELSQMNQAQMEKLKLAAEKKAKLVSEVEVIKKKIDEVEQENERLAKELQEGETIKMEKRRQLEEKKKKDLERLSTATSSNKPQNPAFTPAPSSRPKLLTSPSLKDFRENRVNFVEKNTTSKKSVFDFGSSSDEKQAGGSSNRNSFTTPRKEKKLGVPITPRNSGKPQPLESRARPGPRLFMRQSQGKNKEQSVPNNASSSMVVGVSDSCMESSD